MEIDGKRVKLLYVNGIRSFVLSVSRVKYQPLQFDFKTLILEFIHDIVIFLHRLKYCVKISQLLQTPLFDFQTLWRTSVFLYPLFWASGNLVIA